MVNLNESEFDFFFSVASAKLNLALAIIIKPDVKKITYKVVTAVTIKP